VRESWKIRGGLLSHLKRLSAAAPPGKSLLGGGPVFRRDRPRADPVEVEKPSEREAVKAERDGERARADDLALKAARVDTLRSCFWATYTSVR
jgi:hypothetical protein